ncbi:interferon-gamma-inducible GTPase 10-like [Tenrec ecaudatus]|uniref:interferon-gamma-inducible GTPase 10-like n=1 Tax=Tenrec ecaudatus TaxID=94439 RepID=UPI003F5A28E4
MGQLCSSDVEELNVASTMDTYFQNFNMINKIISEETLNLITSKLITGDTGSLGVIIDGVLKKVTNASLNIAVTGECGSGKSSFINALRGLKPGDEQSADIGVVETTMEPTTYQHPKFPTVIFWDLPGIGTTNFPPEEYLKKVKFGEYDFFIIISSTCFKDTDVQLAKAIKDMGKHFYFVRSKIDIDLQSEQKHKPKTFDQGKFLEQIRNKCLQGFRQSEMETPQIFLISSDEVFEYDTPILMKTILSDLSTKKRHIFMLSLPNITDEVIESKRDSLKQKVWLEAFKNALWATLPLGITSNYDKKKVENSLSEYRALFGVDDASLQKLATYSKVPVEQLKSIIESPHLLEKKKNESASKIFFKWVEKFCLANGGLLAMGFYFRNTLFLQLYMLDKVASDAKILLKKTFSEKGWISPQVKTS